MKHILLFLCLLSLATAATRADIVKGKFIDAQTGQPLGDVIVTITQRYDTGTAQYNFSADSLGRFTTNISGDRSLLEARLIGYHPLKRSFIAGHSSDTLDLGTLALRPSDVLLRSAVVTSRARRFVMHGDTVVFNPEAFKLDEGARLDDLIRQLPGVTQQDGRLYWMGKPVRILMNGEEMFADNSLLTNRLPAEAVERIAAYNKGSDMKRQSGRDDGIEDNVLDIRIKPGFLDRWYGSIQTGYQTQRGYLAQLDAYYLSTHDPLMLFGNWENINRNYFSKTFGGSSSGSSAPYGKQLFGAAGYKHQWERKQGGKTLKNFATFSASAGHDDFWGKQWANRETFFPDEERTFELSDTRNDKHGVKPSAEFYARFEPDSTTSITVRANWKHEQTDRLEETRSAVFAGNPYLLYGSPLDDIFAAGDGDDADGMLTTRSRHTDTGRLKAHTTDAWVRLSHFFRDKSELKLDGKFNYRDRRDNGLTRRDIRYYRTEGDADARTAELTRSPEHRLQAGAKAAYDRWLTRHLLLQTSYDFAHTDQLRRQSRFLLHRLPDFDGTTVPGDEEVLAGVADAANSFREDRTEDTHTAALGATLSLRRLTFTPRLELKRTCERLSYLRGDVDTAVTDRNTIWTPTAGLRWKLSRGAVIETNYAYDTQEADLINTIGYTDSSNPLFVTRGNPDLKDGHSHDASVKFTGNFMRQQRSVILSLSYRSLCSPLTTVYRYDATTGAYDMTWANVRGGHAWTTKCSYEQAAGEAWRLQGDVSLISSRDYGYLTGTPDDAALQLSRSDGLTVNVKPSATFESDRVKALLSGNYTYSHRDNSLTPLRNNDLTRYKATASASWKWRKLTFATQLDVQGYAGYAMRAMNRVRPVWGAHINWQVLRGKGLLRIEADDILNKNLYYYSEQTANERTEQQFENIHHFVNVTFRYNFDARKTKEGQRRERMRRTLDM